MGHERSIELVNNIPPKTYMLQKDRPRVPRDESSTSQHRCENFRDTPA